MDAGRGAEGEGARPGGNEALRVGVRDPGVASIGPRPVVVELTHFPSLSPNRAFSSVPAVRLREEIDGWRPGVLGSTEDGKNG
jgi:hypothetical protein